MMVCDSDCDGFLLRLLPLRPHDKGSVGWFAQWLEGLQLGASSDIVDCVLAISHCMKLQAIGIQL